MDELVSDSWTLIQMKTLASFTVADLFIYYFGELNVHLLFLEKGKQKQKQKQNKTIFTN